MPGRTDEDIKKRVDLLLSQMTLKEKASLLSGKNAWLTVPIQRLDVPSMTMTDGPHGVRSSYPEGGRKAGPTTSFPTGVSMASSWNIDLVEKLGAALAEETRAMDCDILLGPCVNIVRHPLAGRNFEAYSEDPFLAGKIGVAWVKGLQSKRVGASLKHFACNNQEIERGRGDSLVDERTLREIYLSQFEMVVKETQPYTVMCSYNRINGVYASENGHTLREILKDEWGFEGLVVSDWGANHTIVESVKNGLDLEMPGPAKYYGRLIEESVQNWQLDEAAVDDAARRILTILFKVGRFDDPASLPKASANTPEHQQLAREVAEESITLLKNDGALLPLDPAAIKSIAVIGPNAAEGRIGGGGSSFVDPPYRVSPLDALKKRLDGKANVRYAQGCDNWSEPPVLGQDMLVPMVETGQGVKAEFFNNPGLSGSPLDAIYVPKFEFWIWGASLPVTGVTSLRYSIRATGKVTVRESGQYEVALSHTSTCRLLVDGKQILEHTAQPAGQATDESYGKTSVQLDLTAGKTYELTLEYLKDNDDVFGFARLALHRNYAHGKDDRIQKAAELAAQSDAAIVFAGMPEGFESEGHDRPHMRLPGPQAELIRAVVKANPKTIVVLNAGSPVELPWIDEIPAVLEAYYPGQEGGNAVARVLLGEVNPSGKLSVTFPVRLEDTPAFINYPGIREVNYGEGIFVGYRYYDKKQLEPLFPFGHGLSYTSFEYSRLQAPATSRLGEDVQVSVTLKNTGKTAGKEVVQLYVEDVASSLVRPPKELKGFAKVSLQPGETTRVTFTLNQRAFAFYDPYQQNWVVEPGTFKILVGSSSRDIRAERAIEMK